MSSVTAVLPAVPIKLLSLAIVVVTVGFWITCLGQLIGVWLYWVQFQQQ